MSRERAWPSERALVAWVRLTGHDPMEWPSAWGCAVFAGALGFSDTTGLFGYRAGNLVFVVRYPRDRHQKRGQRAVGGFRWEIADVWPANHWDRAVRRWSERR